MSGPVIKACDIGKKYRLFSSPVARLKEALHPLRKRYHNEFWALDTVNFEIESGETFGIIGSNGSGKSTLLQIIAGVLKPTNGMIEVNGRVTALLELGAGFNPEFTGRENVLLNGAIMNVSRGEMLERMPTIEAFADIGEFFDQPVKTYSTGMFARVAFAAAINVDPDILIVDEALSVGDAKFQHKCYENMRKFSARGRTVLFVTHAVDVVVAHCTRTMVLDRGRVDFIGEPRVAVDRYLDLLFGGGRHAKSTSPEPAVEGRDTGPAAAIPDTAPDDGLGPEVAVAQPQSSLAQEMPGGEPGIDRCPIRPSYNSSETRIVGPNGGARIVDYVIRANGVIHATEISEKNTIEVSFKVAFDRAVDRPIYGIAFKTTDGIVAYAVNTHMMGQSVPAAHAGDVRFPYFSYIVDLQPGAYFVDVGVAEVDGSPGGAIIIIRRSVAFIIVKGAAFPKFDGVCDLHAEFKLLN